MGDSPSGSHSWAGGGPSPEPGVQGWSRFEAEDVKLNSEHFIFEALGRSLRADIRGKELGVSGMGFEVRKG